MPPTERTGDLSSADTGRAWGRFHVQPHCDLMTGDCAKLFAADLDRPEDRIAQGGEPGRGPMSLLDQIAAGIVDSAVYTPDEARELLAAIERIGRRT